MCGRKVRLAVWMARALPPHPDPPHPFFRSAGLSRHVVFGCHLSTLRDAYLPAGNYAPLPATGPLALLPHFARMFRGVLAAIAVFIMAVEGINLAVIWGISGHRGRGEREGAGGLEERNRRRSLQCQTSSYLGNPEPKHRADLPYSVEAEASTRHNAVTGDVSQNRGLCRLPERDLGGGQRDTSTARRVP